MLSGLAIKEAIVNGKIIISPFEENQLNPNSYNLRLGRTIATYKYPVLDCKCKNPIETSELEDDEGYVLLPNKVYLAQTSEYTATDYHIPQIEGRSSWGRLGLDIHATAGFGDIGFHGYWTLELSVKQ